MTSPTFPSALGSQAELTPDGAPQQVPGDGTGHTALPLGGLRAFDVDPGGTQVEVLTSAGTGWQAWVTNRRLVVVGPDGVGGQVGSQVDLQQIVGVYGHGEPPAQMSTTLDIAGPAGHRSRVVLYPSGNGGALAGAITAQLAVLWATRAPGADGGALAALSAKARHGGFTLDLLALGLPAGQAADIPTATVDAPVPPVPAPPRTHRSLRPSFIAAILVLALVAGAAVGFAVRTVRGGAPASASDPEATASASHADSHANGAVACPDGMTMANVLYFNVDSWLMVCTGDAGAGAWMALWTPGDGLTTFDTAAWDRQVGKGTASCARGSLTVDLGLTRQGPTLSYALDGGDLITVFPLFAPPPGFIGAHPATAHGVDDEAAECQINSCGTTAATPSPGPSPTPSIGAYGVQLPEDTADDQVRYLSEILDRSAAARQALKDAIIALNSCDPSTYAGASATISSVTQNRRDLIAAVEDAPVVKIPGADTLVSQLLDSLSSSLQADEAFEQWAGAVSTAGCGAGEDARQRGTAASDQAGIAKETFVTTWNTTIAPTYGVPEVTRDTL